MRVDRLSDIAPRHLTRTHTRARSHARPLSNPVPLQALTLIAFSAFHPHAEPNAHIPPLKVSGVVTEIALEASIGVPARRESMHVVKNPTQRARDHFKKEEEFINGVPGTFCCA